MYIDNVGMVILIFVFLIVVLGDWLTCFGRVLFVGLEVLSLGLCGWVFGVLGVEVRSFWGFGLSAGGGGGGFGLRAEKVPGLGFRGWCCSDKNPTRITR